MMKYAIIGDPVTHSLSPAMHNAGFKAVGLDAQYHRIPVKMSELKEGLQFLKDNNYNGWNVTYPLKEAIIPFLDHVSSAALAIGAVNTVKAVDGLLYGHNTDGEGFLQSLLTKGHSLKGKNIVILGAGGAAKAIAVTLAAHQAVLTILNRNESKAKVLAEKIRELGGKASWGELNSDKWLQEVDVLIQTTPIGMKGEKFPFSLEGIALSSLVVDLIYHPARTPFLEEAELRGCATMNGLEMLLYQGVLAWEYWLNSEAPISVMHRALLA